VQDRSARPDVARSHHARPRASIHAASLVIKRLPPASDALIEPGSSPQMCMTKLKAQRLFLGVDAIEPRRRPTINESARPIGLYPS
jgi:hypothetical protein